MDPILIVSAFICGFAAKSIGLPPLVGYLCAGFGINYVGGFDNPDFISTVADLGVTLLLFTIGLKLDLRSLGKPIVWGTATLHMAIVVTLFGLAIYGLTLLGFSLVPNISLETCFLIAFALSFSSTVFAVKALEHNGGMGALHGRVAIGILIMQDIFAVIFLAAADGKIPSIWAIALISLYFLKPVLIWAMKRCGHGELLILYGLVIAFGGYELFKAFGVKGDLGALLLGVLLAGHPKSDELSKTLLNFKELFLVCFFLNIGSSGSPTLDHIYLALILTLIIPFKSALFFFMLTKQKLRARTSLITTLSLSNYSEFGLIVAGVAVHTGLFHPNWLITIAIALSISFIIAAPLNQAAIQIYYRFGKFWKRFQQSARLPEDDLIHTDNAQIAIMGMGRVGTGAYQELEKTYGPTIIGIEQDVDLVMAHQRNNRNVVLGDVADADFWERAYLTRIKLVLMAIPNVQETINAAAQLREIGYKGEIAASARYEDEIPLLHEAGIETVYNFYAEAGTGFAHNIVEQMHLDISHAPKEV